MATKPKTILGHEFGLILDIVFFKIFFDGMYVILFKYLIHSMLSTFFLGAHSFICTQCKGKQLVAFSQILLTSQICQPVLFFYICFSNFSKHGMHTNKFLHHFIPSYKNNIVISLQTNGTLYLKCKYMKCNKKNNNGIFT